MNDKDKIQKLFDFENKEGIERLRKEYIKLTETALKIANENNVDNETALMNRDRVFWDNFLKVIEIREIELGEKFSPTEKNIIIKKMTDIVNGFKL